LNQNKILYVLGAGFSAKAKCPLMPEFTDKNSFKWLKKRLNKKDKKRLEFLESYVLDRMDLGYCHNIEEFLNHVSVGNFLWMESTTEYKRGTNPGSRIFRELQWYIVKLIQEKTVKKIPSEYEKFVRMALKQNATIISFNYDLIVEAVLEKLNKHYAYDPRDKDENHPLILKLHGSGNWYYCMDCNFPAIHKYYVADKILSRRFKCKRCKSVNLEPIIIPPMLSKDYQNPKHGEDLIRFLWHDATNELLDADKVIFIGFSMTKTDWVVQELFKFCSNMNSNIEYEVINSNPSKVSSDYLSALVNREDMITFQKMSFEEYANSL